MELKNTKIKGVKILKSKIFYDNRGHFKEVFRKNSFKNQNFKFDCISFSKKNVLRGLHMQLIDPQDKLITVLKGKIFDVAVDLRVNSKTFGKHVSVILSDKSENALFIPKGFAHGFMCLSENCIVSYKLTNYQNKKSEKTINWFDKDLNIKWPKKKPITSKKDALGLSFKEIKKILK